MSHEEMTPEQMGRVLIRVLVMLGEGVGKVDRRKWCGKASPHEALFLYRQLWRWARALRPELLEEVPWPREVEIWLFGENAPA